MRPNLVPASEKAPSSSSDSDGEISLNTRFYKKIAKAAATTKQSPGALATSSTLVQPGTCRAGQEKKKVAFSNPDTELRLTLRNVRFYIANHP